MADQNWFQKILSGVFDQRGGTMVGISTACVTFMAFMEFVTSGFNRPIIADGKVIGSMIGWHPVAPAWYVAVPVGIFAFILGLFVINRGTSYYMDSRYNSPQDKPPEAKP